MQILWGTKCTDATPRDDATNTKPVGCCYGFETPMCLHEIEEEIHQEEMKKGKEKLKEWTRP